MPRAAAGRQTLPPQSPRMNDFFTVIIVAALIDNIVLTKLLGLCPFMGLSRRLDVAVGVGAATTLVLTAACVAAWALNHLLPPALFSLRPLVFIAAVACAVQATEMVLRLAAPLLHRALGVFLPLIATNCAVLGIMLLLIEKETSFARAAAGGLGGGLGFSLAVVAMALLRQRIVEAQVPAAFRGAPVAVLSAGIMALALSGITGAFR